MVVMGVAVLLFGSRLPEVGRSLGKGIIEFKKGLRGIEDGFDVSSDSHSSSSTIDEATITAADARRRPASSSSTSTPVESTVPKVRAADLSACPCPQMEYGAAVNHAAGLMD